MDLNSCDDIGLTDQPLIKRAGCVLKFNRLSRYTSITCQVLFTCSRWEAGFGDLVWLDCIEVGKHQLTNSIPL